MPTPCHPIERAFLRSGSFGRDNFLLGLRLFFFELETDFSVFQFQVSRKGASFFGNKFVQEIGFSGRNQFLHLLFWDLAMQNVFTDAKATCLGRCDGIFASARTSSARKPVPCGKPGTIPALHVFPCRSVCSASRPFSPKSNCGFFSRAQLDQ